MTMSTPPNYNGHSQRDESLVMAVRDALRQSDRLRIWGDRIHIDASDGKVVISGGVRSRSAKESASMLASQVKGVSTVENNLFVDSDVELAVAQALANDPRTLAAFPGILVGCTFGLVFLKGTVENAAMKAAASEIATKVPGVDAVSNELTPLAVVQTAQKPAAPRPETATRPAPAPAAAQPQS